MKSAQADLVSPRFIKEISYHLEAIDKCIRQHNPQTASLLSGTLSKALYLTSSQMVAEKKSDRRMREIYDCLNTAITQMNSGNQPNPLSLAEGVTGLAATLNILREAGYLDKDSVGLISDSEALISDELKGDLGPVYEEIGYDYFYGLSGIGNSFISFSKFPNSKDLIERICATIKLKALREKEGTKWNDTFSMGVHPYNLGMAHGMLAIMVLLSKAIKVYGMDSYKSLLIQTIDWYLAQENLETNLARFPCSVGDNGAGRNLENRLAWCYGDLSTAIALIHCYQATNDRKYYTEAFRIAKASIIRRNKQFEIDNYRGEIYDCGLCHGLASVAYSYRVLYLYFNDESLGDSYEFWLRALFSRSNSMSDQAAGCYKIKRHHDKENEYNPSFSLLEGACGVGIFLNSLLSPKVDRILSSIFMLDVCFSDTSIDKV